MGEFQRGVNGGSNPLALNTKDKVSCAMPMTDFIGTANDRATLD